MTTSLVDFNRVYGNEIHARVRQPLFLKSYCVAHQLDPKRAAVQSMLVHNMLADLCDLGIRPRARCLATCSKHVKERTSVSSSTRPQIVKSQTMRPNRCPLCMHLAVFAIVIKVVTTYDRE